MLDYELGPIRPPSEFRSLQVRVTRNCPWNRCKFCRFFKGERFEIRPFDEIKQDILSAKTIQEKFLGTSSQIGKQNQAERNVANWLYGGGRGAFLQDANTLVMPTDNLTNVITFLKQTLPSINRVTAYSRSRTVASRSIEELKQLHEAGLSRIHIGLESGCDPLLAFMDKGATADDHVRGGRNVVTAGISLSEYVVLGLGGVKMSREHALETARVINEINPEYIRLRTLAITEDMLLHQEMASGNFVRLTDEQIIEEEKLLIQNLKCHSTLVSDHATNLLQEIEGRLPDEKTSLLAVIDRFQALSPIERDIFKLGRRLGSYYNLDDLNDPDQSEAVERIMSQLGQNGEKGLDENVLYELMEKSIS